MHISIFQKIKSLYGVIPVYWCGYQLASITVTSQAHNYMHTGLLIICQDSYLPAGTRLLLPPTPAFRFYLVVVAYAAGEKRSLITYSFTTVAVQLTLGQHLSALFIALGQLQHLSAPFISHAVMNIFHSNLFSSTYLHLQICTITFINYRETKIWIILRNFGLRFKFYITKQD